MLHRLGWALCGAFGLLAVLALSRALEAGPIDPPGPVGSTMRTMDELLPAWDKQLTAIGADSCNTARFQCVLPDNGNPTGAAVLDRETGLVWTRVPSAKMDSWSNSLSNCNGTFKGQRYGWRMPSVDELTTLLLADAPGPFSLGSSPSFWTTTRYGGTGSYRIYVDFTGFGNVTQADPSTQLRALCVRGGTSHDPQ